MTEPVCARCDDTGWVSTPRATEDGRQVSYAERCVCRAFNRRYQARREREAVRRAERLATPRKRGGAA
jgi:hypothetical protein